MTRTFTCPSCGGPNVFQSSVSVLAVCSYCRATILRRDLDLENLGRMAELQEDSSPIQLKAQGTYRSVRFSVVGRIQLRYERGLWNEWYLLFDDNRAGWLGEAQGTYAVSFVTNVAEKIPTFESLSPGQRLSLGGRAFRVTNVDRATCVAGDGELPFVVGGGYPAPVADLSAPGRTFATIDYSEEPPLVFLGEYVEFDDLHLTGLRQFDGW